MNNIELNEEVLRTDERLRRILWPEIHKIDSPDIKSNDCLLLCAGFESRSLSMITQIQNSRISGFSLGVVSYLPEQPENKINELRAIGRDLDLDVKEFSYDRENPSGMGESLHIFSEPFDRVFVDISGMSRLLIVQILVALIDGRNGGVNVLYSEAKRYAPTKQTFDQDKENMRDDAKFTPNYLSTGIYEIATTPELGSVSMLGESVRLVAFPSFDPTQLAIIIQELQPTYTNIIHGISPRKHNEWRTDAIHYLNQSTLDEIQWKEDHDASTLDYKDVVDIFLDIYKERSAFDRLVISPTGSKMQTVAIGMLRSAMHDVQIVYPTPQSFSSPQNYTEEVSQLYQLDLPPEIFTIATEIQ